MTWIEEQCKREASEISAIAYKALQLYGKKEAKKVYLFCEGYRGQNKKSIMPATMFYMLSKSENPI